MRLLLAPDFQVSAVSHMLSLFMLPPVAGAKSVRLLLEKWEAPPDDDEYDDDEFEEESEKEPAALPSHLKMN